MGQWLFHYRPIDPVTWVYLSSLLVLGLYFKFSRFWSVRNLDLVLVVLLSPGLLMQYVGRTERVEAAGRIRNATRASESPIAHAVPPSLGRPNFARPNLARAFDRSIRGPSWSSFVDREVSPSGVEGDVSEAGDTPIVPSAPDPRETAAKRDYERAVSLERFGFIWLFAVGGLWVIRLLLDPTMIRRPLLEPNLSPGGLLFLGCAVFAFLVGAIFGGRPVGEPTIARVERNGASEANVVPRFGRPGHDWLHRLPTLTAATIPGPELDGAPRGRVLLAKFLCLGAHLAIIVGLMLIGFWHFENTKIGIGTAAMYLFLPYTALFAGHLDHVLPASLLVWAVVCYRRPLLSGLFLGLMCGLSYYGLFLLPLWCSFYWPRGLVRFLTATVFALALACGSLWWLSSDWTEYVRLVRQMYGILPPLRTGLEGLWGMGWDPVFRLPIITVFGMLCLGLALWPPQKNLGTLLGCSAALMVATQFWQAYGGGLYMAWYLPLLLLTIFRPNLEDRVATAVLDDAWFSRRRRSQLKIHAA